MIDAPLRRLAVVTPDVAAAEPDIAKVEEAAAPAPIAQVKAPDVAASEVAAPEVAAPKIPGPGIAAAADVPAEPEVHSAGPANESASTRSESAPAASENPLVAPPHADVRPRSVVVLDEPTAQSTPAQATAPSESLRDSSYIAALAGTIAVVPMVAMVAAVVLYLVGAGSTWTFVPFASLVSAALIWALLGLAARRFATARFANVDEYGQLAIRLERLKAWLDTLPRAATAERANQYPDALAEAAEMRAGVEAQLSSRGIPWVLGMGYIHTWMALHRAEEAHIVLESLDAAIADGLYDELRLEGSEIAHCEELLTKVRRAVAVLSRSAADLYLGTKEPPPAGNAGNDTGADAENMARDALRTVRKTVNEYRDELWGGLVLARNQLVKTIVIAGTGTYLLLLILLVSQVSRRIVLTASVFGVVGALVGLMGWLRTQSGAERAVEDFGLSSARLLASPLFSGLAAVLGVLIFGLAHLNVGTISLGPAPTGGEGVPSLESIFSIRSNPTGFVAAAIFGLTPGLLLDYLQAQSNKIKQGLKSSEASG